MVKDLPVKLGYRRIPAAKGLLRRDEIKKKIPRKDRWSSPEVWELDKTLEQE